MEHLELYRNKMELPKYYKELPVIPGDVTKASKDHKVTRKAMTKGSSVNHVRLKVRPTRCKHVCLKTLVLCIITQFSFLCPRCLGFYILRSVLFWRLYLAHLKGAHQNNFQLVSGVTKRNYERFAKYWGC